MSAAPLVANLRAKVSNLSTNAASYHRGGDVAWMPAVPFGHSSYTWYGVNTFVPNQASIILGSVKSFSTEAAAPVAETAAPVVQKVAAPVAEKKNPEAGAVGTLEDLSEVNFIVGEIKECKQHPDAESLYVEQIDLGVANGGVKEIVSGLVKHVPLDQMIGARVIVVANLKPAKLRGILSNGMVLAAKNDEKVVLVSPPAGAAVGDRIVASGVESKAPAAEINPKKANNAWAAVAPLLKTNANGEVTFNDIVLGTSAGAATAVLNNAIVA